MIKIHRELHLRIDDKFKQMKKESKGESYSEALERIKDLCAMREKSPSDVLSLLKRWGLSREQSLEIISKLKDEKYLDELRFAMAFVRDKVRFDHWGLVKIRYALSGKGIPEVISEKAIQAMDKEEYDQMIKKELIKRSKRLKGPSYEVWQKLARFGSSRGYEMEIMHDMLDEISKGDD